MKTKLTLRLDEAVIERAKAYAARRGTSVSGLVEDYFRLVASPAGGDGATSEPEQDWRSALSPAVRELIGLALPPDADAEAEALREDGAAEAAYGEYLMQKYG